MATEDAGTARHWIVAIIAAAIVLAALLIFGGRKDEPPPTPASSQQTTPSLAIIYLDAAQPSLAAGRERPVIWSYDWSQRCRTDRP
jgi:hypothetical protein